MQDIRTIRWLSRVLGIAVAAFCIGYLLEFDQEHMADPNSHRSLHPRSDLILYACTLASLAQQG